MRIKVALSRNAYGVLSMSSLSIVVSISFMSWKSYSSIRDVGSSE